VTFDEAFDYGHLLRRCPSPVPVKTRKLRRPARNFLTQVNEPFDHGNLLRRCPSPYLVAPPKPRGHIRTFLAKTYEKVKAPKVAAVTEHAPAIPTSTPEHLRVYRPWDLEPDETEIQFLRRTSCRPSDEEEYEAEREKQRGNEEAIRRLRQRMEKVKMVDIREIRGMLEMSLGS
jgi:hypothetical protein